MTGVQTCALPISIEQNRLLKQSDEITIFWTAFTWAVKNGTLVQYNRDNVSDNKKQSHYNLKWDESSEPILQLKLPGIFPEYVRYCKNNGQRYLDSNSLKMLLTSKAYQPFIPNLQKGRGDAYTDCYFGSCYQFRLNKKENVFLINEVEINM